MRKILIILLSMCLGCTILQAQMPELRNNINMDRKSTWQKGGEETVIPVCWENPGNDYLQRAWVKEAVSETWQAVANVRFTG